MIDICDKIKGRGRERNYTLDVSNEIWSRFVFRPKFYTYVALLVCTTDFKIYEDMHNTSFKFYMADCFSIITYKQQPAIKQATPGPNITKNKINHLYQVCFVYIR